MIAVVAVDVVVVGVGLIVIAVIAVDVVVDP